MGRIGSVAKVVNQEVWLIANLIAADMLQQIVKKFFHTRHVPNFFSFFYRNVYLFLFFFFLRKYRNMYLYLSFREKTSPLLLFYYFMLSPLPFRLIFLSLFSKVLFETLFFPKKKKKGLQRLASASLTCPVQKLIQVIQ